MSDFTIEDGVLKKYTGNGGRLNIPETVISVGYDAFWGKTSSIVFNKYKNGRYLGTETNPYHILFAMKKTSFYCEIHPDTRVIMYNAFKSCHNLISVSIPDGVISICAYAFDLCDSLTSVTVPDSVTRIDDSAFAHCTSLTSFKIPNKVTSIATYTFFGCTELRSITIPKNVTEISPGAFDYCRGLTEISVDPENPVYHSDGNCVIDTKEKKLICGCQTSVIPIDGSVTSIGKAFYGYKGLTSLMIPKSVEFISDVAFWGCSDLESIKVDPENKIYHSANNCLIHTKEKVLLLGCKNSVIPDDGSVEHIGRCAFSWCEDLISIIIPDGVRSIGQYAFTHCTGLRAIYLPDSLNNCDIGEFSFSECPQLALYGEGFAIEYAGEQHLRWGLVGEDQNGNVLICPVCGGFLIRKIASKGSNTGNPFYCCSNYPKCRYTQNKID